MIFRSALPPFRGGIVFLSAFAAGILISATACSESPAGTSDSGVASVSIAAPDSVVAVGNTLQITASLLDRDGQPVSGISVEWSSSNQSVASVSSSGLVTGLQEGSVTITARAGAHTATLIIQVENVPVAQVIPNPNALVLHPGGSAQVDVTLRDASGNELQGRTLTWSSAHPAFVGVNGEGLITALSHGGPFMVTVSAEDRIGSLQVSVLPAVDSIAVNPDSAHIMIGRHYQLSAAAFDSDNNLLPEHDVEWFTSNPGVATVDASTGLVTGVGLGSARIGAAWGAVRTEITILVVDDAIAVPTSSGGFNNGCGLTYAGQGYCWGSLQWTGTDSEDVSRTPRPIAGGHTFVAMDAQYESGCGLTTGGEIYCWGRNTYGNLGDGTTQTAYTPVRVASDLTFTSLEVGSLFVCAIADTQDAYCWGNGSYGNLGQGAEASSYTPVKVAGGLKFSQISAGTEHTCGITTDGTAYCWGLNNEGKLGTGDLERSAVPVPVATDLKFSVIRAGLSNTAALTTDGAAYAWGVNAAGSLGTGGPDATEGGHSYTPAPAATDQRFVALTSGHYHYVALTAEGRAYAWGANDRGQLGTGDYTNRGTPVPVSGGHTFQTIGAGQYTTYGVAQTGDFYGWGRGDVYMNGSGMAEDGTVPLPSAAPSFDLRFEENLTVVAGGNASVHVTVTPLDGGLTAYGLRQFRGEVTLTVENLPSGVSGTFRPTTVSDGLGASELAITTLSSATVGEALSGVYGNSTNSQVGKLLRLNVTAPPTSGTGSEKDMRCVTGSTPLDPGYHCMTNSAGQHVPGKYAESAQADYAAAATISSVEELHGTWVDETMGMCITWGPGATATGRYRNGNNAGPPSSVGPGEWGVIVEPDGNPTTPSAYPLRWYVYTEPLDSHTALLSWDTESKQIMGWTFEKRTSCPW